MGFKVYTQEEHERMHSEVDRLYLEKCREVNKLEAELEKMRAAQEGDLISRVAALKAVQAVHASIIGFSTIVPHEAASEILNELVQRYNRTIELINAIPAVSGIEAAKRLAAETEELLSESVCPYVAAELEERFTTQDILCLSSALKNLHDIHNCDSWLLYRKLSRVLEKAVDEYSGKE